MIGVINNSLTQSSITLQIQSMSTSFYVYTYINMLHLDQFGKNNYSETNTSPYSENETSVRISLK